jgi:hypothetical protein
VLETILCFKCNISFYPLKNLREEEGNGAKKHRLSMHEALDSTPSIRKKKKIPSGTAIITPILQMRDWRYRGVKLTQVTWLFSAVQEV